MNGPDLRFLSDGAGSPLMYALRMGQGGQGLSVYCSADPVCTLNSTDLKIIVLFIIFGLTII
jgi:hypothetical protein